MLLRSCKAESRRMTRAAEQPTLRRFIARRMAQKDASGHAEEKHALHHDENPAVTGDFLQEKKVWRALCSGTSCTTVINTFQGREATFASTRGTLTRIDYIAALAEMLARLHLCRVFLRTGIKLQLTRSTRRHDHTPEIAVFK